jgi:antitoxin component YwqK of YwqJK toxin-antitoxin module
MKENIMQDKTPKNKNNKRHGLWERYHDNGMLHEKGLYINGEHFGQHVQYWSNGNLLSIQNYINGRLLGYHNFNCGLFTTKEYYVR